MSNKIKNTLYNKKAFWVLSKWIQDKPSFHFGVKLFQADYFFNRNWYSFRLLFAYFWPFIKAILYAALIIWILKKYNYYYPVDEKIFSNAVIDTFLSAVVSISGVFLGLYFTAVSGIASAFLLKGAQSVRKYFFETPVGEQYVQTVAVTGIVALFSLIEKSLGNPIHPASLVFLLIASAYIVIRFWSVGVDIFFSLEPERSFPFLTKSIADSIKGVIPPNATWRRPTIQNHHRVLAAERLNTMSDLVDFGIDNMKLTDNQLIEGIGYIGGLLIFYSNKKRKIPLNSFWYKSKDQFKNWDLADSSERYIALSTGTPLKTRTVKDFFWFENETLGLAGKIFLSFREKNRLNAIFQGQEIFVGVADVYGANFEEQNQQILFSELEKNADYIFPLENNGVNDDVFRDQLTFIDSQGRVAIGALLGFRKKIEQTNAEQLVNTFSKIDWLSNKGIYLSELPFGVLSRLESLAQKIKNESEIEGRVVTSQWYINALCAQKYFFTAKTYFEYIKSLHNTFFKAKFEKLNNNAQYNLAAQLAQRWLEFSEKYENLVSTFQKHVEDCSSLRTLRDLDWPDFNFEQEIKDAEDFKVTANNLMIALLPNLGTTPLPKNDSPDYFGEVFNRGLNVCYVSCWKNDPERLSKNFRIIFGVSLDEAQKRAEEQVRSLNLSIEDKTIFLTEPLVNLLELSGFALLYSHLYQDQRLWEIVKNVWDEYLYSPEQVEMITKIASVVRFRSSTYKITHYTEMRSSWQLTFNNEMRQRGLPVFPDSRSYNEEPDHPSRSIRIIAKWTGLGAAFSATDFFIAEYLRNVPGAAGIDLTNRHNLQELLEDNEEDSNE